MNIFYLDKEPSIAAKYHCDKHVVKMILESAQILCTVINKYDGYQATPYKSTHANHPCTIWAGKSRRNAIWLYELTFYLNEEYRYRFNKQVNHKSYQMLKDTNVYDKLENYYPFEPFTPPPLAMPDYLHSDDHVESYRMYYRLEKQHLLQYTKRERPDWLN